MMRRISRREQNSAFESLELRCTLTVGSVNRQPIALQVPETTSILRRTPNGAPLGSPVSEFNVVFDTASPGLFISSDVADALGVSRLQAGGDDAVFTHDHATGAISNNISELLYYGLPNPANPGAYVNGDNPKYLELGDPPVNASLADQN